MRQLNDLEANLNTSIITEKSVRKAQDKNLAQELDTIRSMLQAAQKNGSLNGQSDQLAKDSATIAAERQKIVDEEVSSLKMQQKATSKVLEGQIKKMQFATDQIEQTEKGVLNAVNQVAEL